MKRWLVLASLVCALAPAAEIPVKTAKKKLEFLAVGTPSALKIRGKLKPESTLDGKLTLDAGKLNGTLVVKLDDLDTGMELRNSHMKQNYLETQKFPTATLALKDVNVDPKATTNPFTGNLTLHGVEKPVTGNVVQRDGATCFDFSLELSDFGISIPKYLGITVSKTVKVEAELTP